MGERENSRERAEMVQQWASVCCPQLCFPFRGNPAKSCRCFFSACAPVVWIRYIANVSLQMENAWWKFHFRFGIFCLIFLCTLVFALKLLSLRELVPKIRYALREIPRIPKSPHDVKCGELKFTYLKERRTKLIVEVQVQANTHTHIWCYTFYRWIKYNLIYANHYYHCDNV